MTGKLRPMAFTASVLAGAALAAAGSLPATAAVAPRYTGVEVSITYFNNAQHSQVVGVNDTGCFTLKWGTETSYYTINVGSCNEPPSGA